jgi:polysaccharide export outer membrane protein
MPINHDLIYSQEVKQMREGTRDVTEQSGSTKYEYRIGPRDILAITVWDHPELTIPAGEFRSAEAAGHLVADDGTIFYPYAGLVHVGGKTMAEVRGILTQKLKSAITEPQLDVRVAAFRSQKAYVVGEVNEPGLIPINDTPLSVVEAVNLVGGVKDTADMLNVTLNRNGEVRKIDLLAIYEKAVTSENYILQDGDILQVPDRNLQKVFVLGEVVRPSSLILHKGRMSLSEAISDAGGVNQVTSNPARIFVVRGKTKSTEIYHLDSRSADSLVLGDQFKLQARDIVYVDTAGVTRWNRLIEQLLPTTELLRNLSTIETEQNLNIVIGDE